MNAALRETAPENTLELRSTRTAIGFLTSAGNIVALTKQLTQPGC